MRPEDFVPLQAWFAGFAGAFHSADREEQKNIALKEEHTANVCDNIARIAAAEGLDEEQRALAAATALFHDLGRFPQFRRFGTFKDSISVNHAALGAELLIQGRALDKLPRNEQDIVVTAVRLHNALFVPHGLAAETAFFLKLVRDADKLDIWRVFLDYYRLPAAERASAVALGFPDLPEWSPRVLAAVGRGEMAQLAWVDTLNDFKLLQLSWVYDLNFPASFRMLMERGYVESLATTLPDHPRIGETVAAVREYGARRANNMPPGPSADASSG